MRTKPLPALDGLRGLAILLVLWHHLYLAGVLSHLDVGPLWVQLFSAFAASGVFLFFALSGFLLFLPYARSLLGGKPWPHARQFYIRRLLRIFPVYLVAILVLLYLRNGLVFPAPFTTSLLAGTLLYDWRPTAFSVLIATNPPFWTLTIEWQFYLLLPVVALVLRASLGQNQGWSRVWRIGVVLCALIFFGLGIRLLVAFLHYGAILLTPEDAPGGLGVLFCLFYGVKGKYLEIFALGIGVSLCYVWVVEQRRLQSQRFWIRMVLACLALTLAGSLLFAWAGGHLSPTTVGTNEWIFPASPLWSVFGEWFYGLAFCLLLLATVLSPGLSRFFSLAPLRWTGTISYSLYIWHWPLLAASIGAFPCYGQLIVAMTLVVFLAATVSYWLIERPFLLQRYPLMETGPKGNI